MTEQNYLLTIKPCEGLYPAFQFRVVEAGSSFPDSFNFRPFDNPNQIMTVNRQQIAGLVKWEEVKQQGLKVEKL
jgi:hypothetical protein